MQNTAPAAAEQTPRPLQLVPPPLQPLLPVSRRLPDAAAFVKRCAHTRVGDADAKLVYLVLAAHVTPFVDGTAGRCWPSRDALATLCEFGRRRSVWRSGTSGRSALSPSSGEGRTGRPSTASFAFPRCVRLVERPALMIHQWITK